MRKGFATITLLVIVSIIGIAMLIAVPVVLNILDKKENTNQNGKPSITLSNGVSNPYRVEEGMVLDVNTLVKASDDVDGDLTNKIVVLSNNYNKDEVGNYTVVYKVVDSSGNETEYTLTITVGELSIGNSEVSAPNLHDNMIPVYYDESSNEWKKADKSNGSSKWYNYDTYMWANAVTVTSSSRTTYQNASVGTTVNMDDILTMMVWIPRYRYQLWNVVDNETSTEQMINVEFESKSTAKSSGTTNGTWYTHPAFTFGDEELDGIWVGKFETSVYNQSDVCYTTSSVANCNDRYTSLQLAIKPNVSSLRNMNTSRMFDRSINMDENGNMYGYINNTVADTHMMKNTEWGAVAYLSHSKYGKYNNAMYTGANKEIYQNKSSTFITGNSNGTPGQSTTNIQCTYEVSTDRGNGTGGCGTGASTTGTIYGVYDMSGGSYEYVMGVMKENGSENITVGSSGFTNTYFNATNMTKYVDKYAYDTSNATFNRYIKGDATKETVKTWATGGNSWYSDYSYFVYSSSSPWFSRGGSHDNTTSVGAFFFNNFNGGSNSFVGFRLVTK